MIFIEIQSRHIEFYSANLAISAHLSGLRYWMFYWPFLSAFVGIGSILFFITFVCTLSYLHFRNEVTDVDENNEKNDMEEENDIVYKCDNDCKSHFTICHMSYVYLYDSYINIRKKSSFKVSHILFTTDFNGEEKGAKEEKERYIQELSTSSSNSET